MNLQLAQRKRYKFGFGKWTLLIPLSLLAFSTIYPLIFTLNVALKTPKDYMVSRFALSLQPTLENFPRAWTYARIGTYFWNSAITTVGAVILLGFVCSLAAYAIATMRFRLRGALFLIVLAGMMIPPQVVMVTLFRTVIDLHLLNTHVGLILVYTAFAIPFGTYMLTAYYSNIPKEIIEAAKIDGASTWQIYYRIMVPLGKPALATQAIINTLFAWNELLIPLLIMQKRDLRTVMVGVATLRGEHSADMPLLAAAIILGVLPVIVVFLLFQSRLTSGMTMGAVK
jgi:multiple sugar transport system permease protein